VRAALGFAIGDSRCCAHNGVQNNKPSKAVRTGMECMTEAEPRPAS
jgi:hypothetical protein